jgi:quercetin dioxygenase-like cupin family protein
MRSLSTFAAATTVVMLVCAVSAQSGPVPLQILKNADSVIEGREAVAAFAEFTPNSSTGRHTHPGEMVGYIVSGSVRLEQDGRAPVTLKAGDSFIIPAGVAHNHSNVERSPAKMFATYFVEKGRPISELAR